MDEKYQDSEAFQEEVKKQYKERVSKFSPEQVVDVLKALDIKDAPELDEIIEAGAGNVNATYITPHLVIKLNQANDKPDYVANKLVSDRLGDELPVVHVLAYDYFEKTPFEVLIMKRSEGKMLMDDIFEMSEQEREVIFNQVLNVIDNLFDIKFNDFGAVNLDGKESYSTYSAYLTKEFDSYVAKIKAENLCKSEDIEMINQYFKKHIHIFDDCESVFVHTDVHMGNILHEETKLTALLDFDTSLKAPKVRVLNSLLGFIDNPQQYVEGTDDFAKFKGKNFLHLLPILKARFPEIFEDPQLLRKLNIIGLKEGVMWVSQNWSADWNAEMIKGLIENELPENDFSNTYHGKILGYGS